MTDLRTELRAAMDSRGYSYQKLLDESRLALDVSSLHRKLNGAQGLTADEGAALAKTLRSARASAVRQLRDLAKSLGGVVTWEAERRGRAA